MGYNTGNKKSGYLRPGNASGFRTVEKMLADSSLELRKAKGVMPAADVVSPGEWGVYDEPTNHSNPVTDVVCSGAILLLGNGTIGGDHIGITLKDAIAGEIVDVVKQGLFYLPIDFAGDADATPVRVACSLTGLRNKALYYLPGLRLFTNQVPAVGGEDYIKVGKFISDNAEIKPANIGWGIYYAKCEIYPVEGLTAVDYPAGTGSTVSTGSLHAFADVSDDIGLTVDLFANIFNTDPGFPVPPSSIEWTVDGVDYVGNAITATLGTAGTKAVTLDVSWNGLTLANTYNLVVSTTLAPTLTQT